MARSSVRRTSIWVLGQCLRRSEDHIASAVFVVGTRVHLAHVDVVVERLAGLGVERRLDQLRAAELELAALEVLIDVAGCREVVVLVCLRHALGPVAVGGLDRRVVLEILEQLVHPLADLGIVERLLAIDLLLGLAVAALFLEGRRDVDGVVGELLGELLGFAVQVGLVLLLLVG